MEHVPEFKNSLNPTYFVESTPMTHLRLYGKPKEAQPQDLFVTLSMPSETTRHSGLSPPTQIQKVKAQKQIPPAAHAHALTISQVLFS
jgi:hypothetical protein